MTQFAVTAIFVVVVSTSCHTLSAIVAGNAVTSYIVDDLEVATCLALKRALHEVECTEAENTHRRLNMDRQTHIPDTNRQMDTQTDGHTDTHTLTDGHTHTYLITAPKTFFMALLTLLCVIVREGLTADTQHSDK